MTNVGLMLNGLSSKDALPDVPPDFVKISDGRFFMYVFLMKPIEAETVRQVLLNDEIVTEITMPQIENVIQRTTNNVIEVVYFEHEIDTNYVGCLISNRPILMFEVSDSSIN